MKPPLYGNFDFRMNELVSNYIFSPNISYLLRRYLNANKRNWVNINFVNVKRWFASLCVYTPI